jgi:tRNA (guanine-N7-)-methyltransferase
VASSEALSRRRGRCNIPNGPGTRELINGGSFFMSEGRLISAAKRRKKRKLFVVHKHTLCLFAAKLLCVPGTYAVTISMMPFSDPPTSAAPPAIAAANAARRAALAATLTQLYPEPASIIFEIGCGHGHFLSAYAAAHPESHCLGVDLVTQRIECAIRKQTRLGLKNLAFLKADAAETLSSLPPHVRLAGIFVLFPDPWPKQRHHHRRLLQTPLLEALTARANPKAWLAIRTDDSQFFDWAKIQINNNLTWNTTSNIPWPFEHTSDFQEIKGPHQSLLVIKH